MSYRRSELNSSPSLETEMRSIMKPLSALVLVACCSAGSLFSFAAGGDRTPPTARPLGGRPVPEAGVPKVVLIEDYTATW